jgi:mannose/fructose-specific phosphotransferase system component IIA
MGARFIVTGVQLGLLITANQEKKENIVEKLIDNIIDKQYIGTSSQTIEGDAEMIKSKIYFK